MRGHRLDVANEIATKRLMGLSEWQQGLGLYTLGRLRKWNLTEVDKNKGYNKPHLKFMRFKEYRRNGDASNEV